MGALGEKLGREGNAAGRDLPARAWGRGGKTGPERPMGPALSSNLQESVPKQGDPQDKNETTV